MSQLIPQITKDGMYTQVDVETWKILKKAVRNSLSGRGIDVDEDEVSLITRFTMEHIEISGLRVVPLKPTTIMQNAIKHSLDDGKRMSIAWVKPRTKQRWRYQAAINAAPSWRRGYLHEATRSRIDTE